MTAPIVPGRFAAEPPPLVRSWPVVPPSPVRHHRSHNQREAPPGDSGRGHTQATGRKYLMAVHTVYIDWLDDQGNKVDRTKFDYDTDNGPDVQGRVFGSQFRLHIDPETGS